jgi:hypothetical protein
MSVLISESAASNYLAEYYTSVGQENAALLDHYANNYHLARLGSRHLEIGGGPTVYQLISLSNRVSDVTFTDYSSAGLASVADWMEDRIGAKDWDEFINYAINTEGSIQDLEIRKKQMRALNIRLVPMNIFEPQKANIANKYDSVSLNFIAESVAENEEQWNEIINNSGGFLKPGGLIFMSAIRNAETWKNGDDIHVCYSVNEQKLINDMSNLGYDLISNSSVDADSLDDEGTPMQGYDGLMFFVFKKR